MKKTISRAEASTILGISEPTLCRIEKDGLMPFPVDWNINPETKRKLLVYDRKKFMDWAKTKPNIKY